MKKQAARWILTTARVVVVVTIALSLGSCKKCVKCCTCTCLGTGCCGTAVVEGNTCLDCEAACRDACDTCPMATASPCEDEGTEWPPPCEDGMPVTRTVDFSTERPALDILAVIDNSMAQEPKQVIFADAVRGLLSDLLDPPVDPVSGARVREPLRDVHIGVVSMDMGVGGYDVVTCSNPLTGDDGVLQHEPGLAECEESYPAFLTYSLDDDAEPDSAVVQKLADDFRCIAVLGGNGCGFEQPLAAARKALTVHALSGGANDGFLRPHAKLAVIFLAEENDCSAADPTMFDPASLDLGALGARCYTASDLLMDVSGLASDLMRVKENSNDILIGMIVGVPPDEPACNGRGDEIGGCLSLPSMEEQLTELGDTVELMCDYPPNCTADMIECTVRACPATRMVQFAQAFHHNAVIQSICDDDFLPAVTAITDLVLESFGGVALGLATYKDPNDPCRCLVDCAMYETLGTEADCPAPKVAVTTIMGDSCDFQTVCEIPQAGIYLDDCSAACGDPAARYHTSGDGWYFAPATDVSPETLGISPSLAPAADSSTELHCCM